LPVTRRDFLKAFVIGLGAVPAIFGRRSLVEQAIEAPTVQAMNKRRLGRTNLMVSVIGLGGAPIQFPSQVAVVQEAINMGVNFIDTAHAYGRSETVIGQAIKGMREKVFIATKIDSRYAEEARVEVQDSLRALQIEKIDLLQMHAVGHAEALEAILDPEKGALLAARELQEQGQIGYVGITGAHSPIDGPIWPPEAVQREFEVMMEAIRTGQFDTTQISYHIEWQGAQVQQLIALAKEYDVGVIVKKPLGRGKLIPEYGVTSLLQFVLENSDVHTAIPGMNTIEQVYEDVPVGINGFTPHTGPVGGILMPVKRLAIQVPYVASLGLIGAAIAAFAIRKRRARSTPSAY